VSSATNIAPINNALAGAWCHSSTDHAAITRHWLFLNFNS